MVDKLAPAARSTLIVLLASDGPLAVGLQTLPPALEIVDGLPVLVHAATRLRRHPQLADAPMIVTAPPGAVAQVGRALRALDGPRPVIIEGAQSLDGSVHCVLQQLARGTGWLSLAPETRVIIHQACRPLISHALIGRVLLAGSRSASGAAAPALVVTETIKSLDATGRVVSTIAREGLLHVQSPQVCNLSRLQDVHRRCLSEGDRLLNCLVGEGIDVSLVAGEELAMVVLTDQDRSLVSALNVMA